MEGVETASFSAALMTALYSQLGVVTMNRRGRSAPSTQGPTNLLRGGWKGVGQDRKGEFTAGQGELEMFTSRFSG